MQNKNRFLKRAQLIQFHLIGGQYWYCWFFVYSILSGAPFLNLDQIEKIPLKKIRYHITDFDFLERCPLPFNVFQALPLKNSNSGNVKTYVKHIRFSEFVILFQYNASSVCYTFLNFKMLKKGAITKGCWIWKRIIEIATIIRSGVLIPI